MKREAFPKSARVLRRAEFDGVFRRRCSVADGLMVMYVADNHGAESRLGLVVSRKVGNAVRRNRWKRKLREAFRMRRCELPRGIDLVVLPRPGDPPAARRLEQSLVALVSKAVSKLHGAAKG